MNKLLIAFSILAVAGFGCAPNDPSTLSTPVTSRAPNATEITTNPTPPTAQITTPTNDPSTLQELPSFTPPGTAIDDSTWVTTTTRAGVSVTAPVKGTYAPTWTLDILASTDPHLQGNCYLADGVAYQKTSFSGFENACQTTSAFSVEAGTRTDYFVMRNETNAYLITFTKVHSANFNMNDYSATLDHVINIID